MNLLDHLVIHKTILCGLSMGGYIALRAYERHPERIRALVLCDTKSEPDLNEAKLKRSAIVKNVKTNGVTTFADEFALSVFAPYTFQAHPEIVASIVNVMRSNSPIGISGASLAMGCRTDTTSVLAEIRVPTLILVGELDKLTPPAVAESMHKKISGSEYHVIPDAAHMSNVENAPEFNRYLIEFLNRVK